MERQPPGTACLLNMQVAVPWGLQETPDGGMVTVCMWDLYGIHIPATLTQLQYIRRYFRKTPSFFLFPAMFEEWGVI